MYIKEQFTKVTPISRIIAMMLFIALPFMGFVFGVEYQKGLSPSLSSTTIQPVRPTVSPISAIKTTNPTIPPTPLSCSNTAIDCSKGSVATCENGKWFCKTDFNQDNFTCLLCNNQCLKMYPNMGIPVCSDQTTEFVCQKTKDSCRLLGPPQ